MAALREGRKTGLRFSVGVSGPKRRTQSGVLVFTDIPPNSNVFAEVDRPTELLGDGFSTPGELSDNRAAQPYRFEKAQMPAQFITTGGVVTVRPYSLNRVLTTDGLGKVMPSQTVPAFAAFGAPQDGALVQRGRKEHLIPMPGGTNGNIFFSDRSLLRLRWTATLVAGETQTAPPLAPGVPDGSRRSFTGQLGNTTAANNIAPGSVSMTAPVAGGSMTIRDDGAGRLAGVLLDGSNNIIGAADGTIDYLNGSYELTFGDPGLLPAPDAGNIVATYEKGCTYRPLDVDLSWDSLAQ